MMCYNQWFKMIHDLAPTSLYVELLKDDMDNFIDKLSRADFIRIAPRDLIQSDYINLTMYTATHPYGRDKEARRLLIPYFCSPNSGRHASFMTRIAELAYTLEIPVVVAIAPNTHGSNIVISKFQQLDNRIGQRIEQYNQLEMLYTNIMDDSQKPEYHYTAQHVAHERIERIREIETLHSNDWDVQSQLFKKFKLQKLVQP